MYCASTLLPNVPTLTCAHNVHAPSAYPPKIATDLEMIIDAMGLLRRGHYGCFCLATSDSDFRRLAVRIREEGLVVHGFGERDTPRSFIAA